MVDIVASFADKAFAFLGPDVATKQFDISRHTSVAVEVKVGLAFDTNTIVAYCLAVTRSVSTFAIVEGESFGTGTAVLLGGLAVDSTHTDTVLQEGPETTLSAFSVVGGVSGQTWRTVFEAGPVVDRVGRLT